VSIREGEAGYRLPGVAGDAGNIGAGEGEMEADLEGGTRIGILEAT